jgi:putative membrane protein
MHDWGFGYGFGGMWMWLLFLAVIGVLIYLLVTASKKSGSLPGIGKESPMEILKRRYAAGEISREEFELMKKELQD